MLNASCHGHNLGFPFDIKFVNNINDDSYTVWVLLSLCRFCIFFSFSQSFSRLKLCSANGQRLDWPVTIQCFPLPLGLVVVVYLKKLMKVVIN